MSKRFVKKQAMRWTPRGAHRLLQTRARVPHDELEDTLGRWYPASDSRCWQQLSNPPTGSPGKLRSPDISCQATKCDRMMRSTGVHCPLPPVQVCAHWLWASPFFRCLGPIVAVVRLPPQRSLECRFYAHRWNPVRTRVQFLFLRCNRMP